jgi:hypothetical protein
VVPRGADGARLVVPERRSHAESIAFEMLFGGAAEISYTRKIGADAWFEFRGVDRNQVQEQSFCSRTTKS